MNRPATIDGSAVIASVMVRTSRVKAPGISLRKTAQARPSGITMTRAIAMMMSVPRLDPAGDAVKHTPTTIRDRHGAHYAYYRLRMLRLHIM